MTFLPQDRTPAAPRALVGGREPRAREVLAPMVTHFGWTPYETRDRLAVVSPGNSLAVSLDVRRPQHMQWEVRRYVPHWFVQFSRGTPVEAVGHLVFALPQLVDDHRFGESIGAFPTAGLAEVAARAQWAASRTEDGVAFTSSDGRCSLRHTPQAIGIHTKWAFQHSHAEGTTDWEARFTAGTPIPLVARFFTSLTSVAPAGHPAPRLTAAVQKPPRALAALDRSHPGPGMERPSRPQH
ncbi:DUF317 domain-containing protein [Streptomyces sp. NPDC051561]|uniref:DUF317 domain-containing protein n=1 Tax=Streptomyces sp. NPDC051561 TaxID=3365658 RepID=UPI00378B3F43